MDPAKLQLLYYPHPALRKVCTPFENFGPELEAIAARMLAIMHGANGVGLAGPQVGLEKRIFVCNVTGEAGNDCVYVNPELSDFEGFVETDEGCLSLPEVNVLMRRAKRVTIRALTVSGEPVCEHGEDLLARVWQHETDHLDGKLIIDHMSEADRMSNRRILKDLEQRASGRKPGSGGR